MRRRRIFFHLFPFALMTSQASAMIDSDSVVRALFRSRTPAALELQLDAHARKESMKRACRSELELRLVPISCFEPLAERRVWLKELCFKVAATTVNRRDLSRALASAAIPEECRQRLADRVADLDYRESEQDPKEIAIRETGE